MTKRSPVSATRQASSVDEAAVRQAVIAGMVDSDICKTEAFGNAAAIRELLSVRRQQWIDEMDGKLLSRTETAVHIARRVDWGNNRVRMGRVTLPAISMHIAELEDRRQKACR